MLNRDNFGLQGPKTGQKTFLDHWWKIEIMICSQTSQLQPFFAQRTFHKIFNPQKVIVDPFSQLCKTSHGDARSSSRWLGMPRAGWRQKLCWWWCWCRSQYSSEPQGINSWRWRWNLSRRRIGGRPQSDLLRRRRPPLCLPLRAKWLWAHSGALVFIWMRFMIIMLYWDHHRWPWWLVGPPVLVVCISGIFITKMWESVEKPCSKQPLSRSLWKKSAGLNKVDHRWSWLISAS